MNGYINKKALLEFAKNHKDGQIDANDIARFHCADVVPKSEVEKIFFEIVVELHRKMPHRLYPIVIDDKFLGNSYELGQENLLYDLLNFIAELKKKYTEEQV